MSDGFALEPGELAAAAGTLTSAASAVERESGTLRVTPDAGASSHEVSGAFGRLAEELRTVAEVVSRAAGEVDAARTAYRTTDGQVGGTYQGLGQP